MRLDDFFDAVEAHEELKGLGIREEVRDGETKHTMIVTHPGTMLTSELSADVVEEVEWKVLEPILCGRKEPDQLYHMTRVCGYYARVSNFNKGKVGELRDRQKGEYSVG